ncbi:MAG TPA: hypothetical protein VFL86_27985 [Burkholderiaceae bacterium]|nr:hypothetical protein [Burkholderiaceae bacterium]
MSTEPADSLPPAEQLANALASWRSQRAAVLAGTLPRHSVAWLHAAVEGLLLGLQAGDLPLARLLAGEAIAATLASVYGGAAGATATVALAEAEPQRMACRPCPAHRWHDALLLACLAARPAHLAALARALPPTADPGGDAWALVAGRAWLGLLAGRTDLAGRLDALRMTAASDEERAWVRVQDALRARSPVPPAALAALPRLQALAVEAWLRGRGQVADLSASPALDALADALVPPVHLDLAGLVAVHAREPGWWLDLYGIGGERSQRLVTEDGHLVARYDEAAADAGLSLQARFTLADEARPPEGAPALDAGELLVLADRRAQAADATPPQDEPARRHQRALLDEAVDLVATAMKRLPAGRPAQAGDFPSALGRAAFEADPGRFDRERLDAVRQTYAGIVAQADAAPGVDARQAALAAIGILKTQLEPLLWAVARDTSGELAASLQPRAEDYAKVFTAEVAGPARAAFEAGFARAGRPKPADPGQTQLICHLAPAGMLASENELSHHFPGGYRHIAALLNPQRVWVRWKFCRPHEPAGMAYDGLVWVDDHWAWFPKAYRVLGDLTGG